MVNLVNRVRGALPYSTELSSFLLSVLDPYPVTGNKNRGRVFLSGTPSLCFLCIASSFSCTNYLSAVNLLKNWVASSQPSLSTTGGRLPTTMGSRPNTNGFGE